MASTSDIEALREKVLLSLKKQGFIFDGERIRLPKNIDKEGLRQLHRKAVQTRRKRSEGGLIRHEARLLSYIVSGTEVVPDRTLVRQMLFAINQIVKCASPTSSTCSTLIFSKTPRIIHQRDLHKQMDETVLHAYDWHQESKYGPAINLAHDFYEVDYLPENDRVRYTISPKARKEVLKRLLLLNHEIYEDEVRRGLHDKKKAKHCKGRTKAADPMQIKMDIQ